jgi:hypothetical protein
MPCAIDKVFYLFFIFYFIFHLCDLALECLKAKKEKSQSRDDVPRSSGLTALSSPMPVGAVRTERRSYQAT